MATALAWAAFGIHVMDCADGVVVTVFGLHFGPADQLRQSDGRGEVLVPAADWHEAL
ncbi:hypothetical protein ACWCQQ_32045 [Streptomyces sp. NPDC002143]